jgi:hypothetical protein
VVSVLQEEVHHTVRAVSAQQEEVHRTVQVVRLHHHAAAVLHIAQEDREDHQEEDKSCIKLFVYI